MKNKEKIYDNEIQPLMDKIIEICNKHKIPMFAEFQYSNQSTCKTLRLFDGNIIFEQFAVISKCRTENGINIDKYFMWLLKQAREKGHSSVFIDKLLRED